MLQNYCDYFLRRHGSVLYRGLEMAQQGRMLTVVALYYRYTRDGETVLPALDRINGVAQVLSACAGNVQLPSCVLGTCSCQVVCWERAAVKLCASHPALPTVFDVTYRNRRD